MPHELLPSESAAPLPNTPRKIAIVVSQYNENITGKLRKGAITTLLQAGIADDDILVVHVPGAWELTYLTQQLIQKKDIRGVIALGAVIRGETTHDQHINRAVSMSLMQLSVDHGKPVAFGLLTVNNLEQAIQRSGGTVGNKGQEAADALLQCLRLSQSLA